MSTLTVFANLSSWVERKTVSRRYPIYLTILLVCCSLFLAFPRYDKKVFRLTVPVIIRVFHLNRAAVLAIQFILGVMMLYFSYLLANRILHDPVSATFFTGGIAFLYCGKTCFTEITYTWFDGWAYFFLLMAWTSPVATPISCPCSLSSSLTW